MAYEPVLRPGKWEMCRAIREWVTERCGIEHAAPSNLDRLNETDLQLIYLAIGYKLDIRIVASMEKHFLWAWEQGAKYRTVDGVADQKAISDET